MNPPVIESAPASTARWWQTPPRHKWLLALTAPLATWVWASTYPGTHVVAMIMVVFPCLVALGLIWTARLLLWRRAGRPGNPKSWLIAPALVIATWIITTADIALWIRFELFARDDFNAVIRDLEPQGSHQDWVQLEPPARVGGYTITRAYQVDDNVILWEATGHFFDYAGFAYLPNGPDPRFASGWFEAPSFRHLGGHWYAWTASW